MKTLSSLVLVLVVSLTGPAKAETLHIDMELGDYRFRPDKLEVAMGQEVALHLHNNDRFTPHDFVLQAPEAGLDISVDVPPGATEIVRFTPGKAGFFPFYCSKRLLFFKSHRERGMHGLLTVNSR